MLILFVSEIAAMSNNVEDISFRLVSYGYLCHLWELY